MPDYETIAPEHYLARFDTVPRERYLLDHWRPITLQAVNRYCRGRVLDLGCGFGDYTRAIERADLIIGVDLSARWTQYARNLNGIRNVVQADAQQTPIRAGVLDAVLSIGLLEYVSPQLIAAEIVRLLKPGGYCVLVCVNSCSAFRITLRLILALRKRPNDAYDGRETSLRALRNAMHVEGLEIVESCLNDGLIWLPDWLDRAIGKYLYKSVELAFRPLAFNPFSNGLLLVGRKRDAPKQGPTAGSP